MLLYGAETWAVTQQELRQLHAFRMKCLRETVGVKLWDRRRNVDILEETGELLVEEQHCAISDCSVWAPPENARQPATEAGSEMPITWNETETWRNLAALGRPRSQRPVQPSSMERACEEQVSIVIHHSTAPFAGHTDKRCLHTKILLNVQPWTRSSEEEVCALYES